MWCCQAVLKHGIGLQLIMITLGMAGTRPAVHLMMAATRRYVIMQLLPPCPRVFFHPQWI